MKTDSHQPLPALDSVPMTPDTQTPLSTPIVHAPPACSFCGGHAEVSEALPDTATGPRLCDGCTDLALESLIARQSAAWT